MVYTIFTEGLLNNIAFVTVIDYSPPTSFNLRVFHASPNVPIVDALMDGSSKGFNGITFTKNTQYVSFNQGAHNFTIQTANEKVPSNIYISEIFTNLSNYNDYSVFFVGMMNPNITHNNTHFNNTTPLETVILMDDNTLPTTAGNIKIRFVHTALNTPTVSLSGNGVNLFSGIKYKQSSNYTIMQASVVSFNLLITETNAAILTSTIDLRVKDPSGTAVYTIVAEGINNPQPGQPPVQLYAFLDNGEPPPSANSSTGNGGLGPVAIGLIIAGVAVLVVLVAAGGFIFWKKRNQRAGYSEIESHPQ